MLRSMLSAVAAVVVLTAGGCAAYHTPGQMADFSKIGLSEQDVKAMTDYSVREVLAKRPMVVFPTAIAVVRVQSGDYHYQRWNGEELDTYGSGAFSVVTVRDVETDEDFQKLARLPQDLGVAPLKKILLPAEMKSDLELRTAAAKLHAGLLLYYTFDTRFYTDEKVAPLSVITLGIAPNHQAHVTTTASAVLMDVNNGYVYGVYEGTSSQHQLANAWTSAEAMEEAKKRAEREAFEKLVGEFTNGWGNVVAEYKVIKKE